MDRFAPQQNTDYVALLNEWAVGFYTELDFLNEMANQQAMKARERHGPPFHASHPLRIGPPNHSRESPSPSSPSLSSSLIALHAH